MLVRERIEQAEQTVPDRERVDLPGERIAGPEGRVDPRVRTVLLVERDADVLHLRDQPAVEAILDRIILGRVADRYVMKTAGDVHLIDDLRVHGVAANIRGARAA